MTSQTERYTYSFSPRAYCCAVLHALHHPSCTVIGLLAGKLDCTIQHVSVLTAIPLLHSTTQLKPLLHVSLEQVVHTLKQMEYVPLGCYAVNERKNDTTVNEDARSIIVQLKMSDYGVLWQLDNRELCPQRVSGTVHHTTNSGNLVLSGSLNTTSSARFNSTLAIAVVHHERRGILSEGDYEFAPETTTTMLERLLAPDVRAQDMLVDFEDFSENINLDYTNEHIPFSVSS